MIVIDYNCGVETHKRKPLCRCGRKSSNKFFTMSLLAYIERQTECFCRHQSQGLENNERIMFISHLKEK